MKEAHRSRRSRWSHRRHQLTKSATSDEDDDEPDHEHRTVQQKPLVRSNKNANQMPVAIFDDTAALSSEDKQSRALHSSSDQSLLLLFSINSTPKPTAISDDLTPLSSTTTHVTALTALTSSVSKQMEAAKGDLTELSGTDTLGSSPVTSEHDQVSSIVGKISSAHIADGMHAYDTDTSMRSVAFSKINSLADEHSYQKHAPSFTVPAVQNEDSPAIATSSVRQGVSLLAMLNHNANLSQRSPIRWSPTRWSWQNTSGRLKFLIGCSSLGLIAGIVVLIIIL